MRVALAWLVERFGLFRMAVAASCIQTVVIIGAVVALMRMAP
jgi:hypothetical protein